MFPNREGVVTDLYVNEGQQVKSGRPALHRRHTGDRGRWGGRQCDKARRAETSEGDAGHTRSPRNSKAPRRSGTVSRRSSPAPNLQIADLRSQIDIQTQRVQVAETLVTTAQDLLAKGYMSAVEGKRREDTMLEQKQNLASLRRQLAEQQSKLAEAQYSLKELPTATSRKIQPLRDQISEADQRSAESKGRGSYMVRAPGAGRISMLQVSKGQTVQPQHLQLEIVPDGSPLQAELLIPTRAAGFVRIGEQVRFLYDAFPYQNFGAYTGRISELSHTVLTKSDTAGPYHPEEPVYKAVAVLDRARCRCKRPEGAAASRHAAESRDHPRPTIPGRAGSSIRCFIRGCDRAAGLPEFPRARAGCP